MHCTVHTLNVLCVSMGISNLLWWITHHLSCIILATRKFLERVGIKSNLKLVHVYQAHIDYIPVCISLVFLLFVFTKLKPDQHYVVIENSIILLRRRPRYHQRNPRSILCVMSTYHFTMIWNARRLHYWCQILLLRNVSFLRLGKDNVWDIIVKYEIDDDWVSLHDTNLVWVDKFASTKQHQHYVNF